MDLDYIRSRIDLVQVVSHYQTLDKKGRVYMGLCPFHADHHPSLRVDPVKGLYHCFSCGAGGDAFRFVQEKEGCGFMEAVRICADICRVTVLSEVVVPAKATQVPVSLPTPTLEENERFRQSLLPYDPGHEELRDVYNAFGVGIAPANVPEKYGFTRGRIVFPIHDTKGRLVAFAARYQGTPPSKKIPKYLNSSTSMVYKKDELLYAWHVAVGEACETGILFITEGYKDTLAMHAAGFTNTVALCGTNLSVHHIDLIRKHVPAVCLLLDADEVGRETVTTVIPELRSAGLKVTDLSPEGGKDPDEMFRLLGREAFAAWVRRGMVSPGRKRAERLLVTACLRWPDTCCLTAEGQQVFYMDEIKRLLEQDDWMPEGLLQEQAGKTAVCNGAALEELDREYELHTDTAHSEPVRHSELVRYFLLEYLEVRLVERIRRNSYRLSHASLDEEQRGVLLSWLQYDRDYLRNVSEELGRRG